MPGPVQMKGDGKKAEQPMRALGRLLKYTFSRNIGLTVCVFIFVLFASAASVTAASFIAPIVSDLLQVTADLAAGVEISVEISSVYTNIIIMGCIYFVGAASSLAYNLMMMLIAQRTLKSLRNDMFKKMQTLPLQYFDSHTHGDIMSLYTNDVDTMRMLLTQSIPQMITAILTFLFVLGFMIYYSFMLTIIVIVYVVAVSFIIRYFGGRSSREFVKQQKAVGKMNGFVEEMTEGQKVVKVFCHEQKAREEFKVVNDEVSRASTRANTYSFMLGPINNNMGWLEYVIVAVIGIVLIGVCADGKVGWGIFLSPYGNGQSGDAWMIYTGMLLSFMVYTRQFNQPVQQVSQQFNAIVMALAGAERIFKMVDEKREDKGGNVVLTYGEYEKDKWAWKKPVGAKVAEETEGDALALEHHHRHEAETDKERFEYIPLRGDIKFSDVYFGYTDDKVILKDISLYAKPTQKIAFVGSTGAGKTTVINLISRFYDIQAGTITYDDIPIRDIKKSDLRKSLGIVLQDTHLFTTTVMENIRYGRLDATDEECVEAAKLACADSFIRHLPEGYDTVIMGDGSNLSQGQRQLLAIARAMVSRCPVLVLDEATSSIDTRTEKLIDKGLDRLMEGRTVFIIAHRLSTVRNCHAIMVLEHGEIIERGTHQQLLDKKGTYYQLYTGAFELD
ncbi:MAG: ABC transporter ATP-binding protein/permease [Clostridia bacterium]|nr:ABC transporter ATP-binding protein/permease [Clostridia bacterium]